MPKLILSLFCLALWLAACSPNKPSSAPPSQPVAMTPTGQTTLATPTLELPTSNSQANVPTSTPLPATAAVSPTPVKPLPKNHPLVAYQAGTSPDNRLILIDPADGTSWEYSFPAGSVFTTPFIAGLSPDARYFVYYEGGRVNEYGQFVTESPDLVMHVYDLDQHKVIFTTPLLSPGYPEDLKPLVEMTEDQYWMSESERQDRLESMHYTTQHTMMDKLRSVAWSPDGDLLAFASQNPGPSSDLYFYGPYSGKAWQVTSELGHVWEVTWAPISQWDKVSSKLVLETTLYFTQATRITADVLTRAGLLMSSVDDSYFRDWLDDDMILLNDAIDFGDPYYHLVLMSVDKNIQVSLWDGSFDEVAVSPDASSLLLGSSQPNEPGQAPGLYLVNRETETTLHLSESIFWKVAYWDSDQFAYAASAPDTGIFDVSQTGGTYGVTLDGELTLIDEGNWYLLPSPDGNYLAGYGPFDTIAGLRLFDGDGKLLTSLSDAKVACLEWDAASTSLVYQVGKRAYLWETGDETARQIAGDLDDELDWWECGFTWVNSAP